jgi:hypothetical protein
MVSSLEQDCPGAASCGRPEQEADLTESYQIETRPFLQERVGDGLMKLYAMKTLPA